MSGSAMSGSSANEGANRRRRPRPRGEGGLDRLPDGRWRGRYHFMDGSARKRRAVYGRTQAEVTEKLKAAIANREAGRRPSTGKETVASYLESWLEGHKMDLSGRGYDSYRFIVNRHLIPRFGRARLSQLQPQAVRQAYQEMLDAGLSPKSVANVHGVLHKALEQAVEWRQLAYNPIAGVRAPRVPRQEMRYLTPEQARRVLEAAAGDRLEALWRLAITAGLRQGELLALRWPEVDLEAGTVSVVATLEQRRGLPPALKEPKTARSRRQVDIGTSVVQSLQRHRQAEKVTNPTGFVFHQGDGQTPLTMSIVYKAWTELNERAGAPRIRFHDLRHTCATLMFKQGQPAKLVSEMLGHASIAITMDRYSHVMPTMRRQAADAMEALLGEL